MDLSLILIGHGKLGQTIEKMAIQQNIPIKAIFTSKNINEFNALPIESNDIVIENTNPHSAAQNLLVCAERGVPTISGSTGWLDRIEEVHSAFQDNNGTLLIASNFSIAMNIFFEVNRMVASKIQHHKFNVHIEEKHHVEKKDAPSGTAITLAKDIISNHAHINDWHLQETESSTVSQDSKSIPIRAYREADVKGTHDVLYSGKYDQINMQHKASSREAFGEGAILAAQWLQGKKGLFTMKDVLDLH